MSNIDSPRRTEASAWTEGRAAQAAAWVAGLILTVLLVTFRPFSSVAVVADSGGGDTVNQLGFGMLGAVAIASLAMLVDRRRLAALAAPWWLALFGLAALSVAIAPEAGDALRSFMFTTVAVISVAAFLSLPRSADSYALALLVAASAVLGLSFAGLVLLPDAAVHQSFEVESEHAGLWRGLFAHKNIAGPVMACLAFVGFYLFLRGSRLAGGLIMAAALLFVMNTGSKTAAGLIPLTVAVVFLPRLLGLRAAAPLIVAAGLVLGALATVGIVLIEPIGRLAALHAPDLTYTGRLTLWEYAAEMIAQRPWTGYGYESFWEHVPNRVSVLHFDQAWDVRNSVHAHNGYLDIALGMGLPALLVALFAFIVVPLRDYARVPPLRENQMLADLFLMILAYTLFNALLESFFFRRADPVWLLFVMAALGLRMTARFPVATSDPPR